MASKTLSDVPEEGDSYPSGLSIDSRSPYSHTHTTGSSSTFHGGDRGDRGSVSSLSNISINPPRSPGPNGPRRPSSRVHPGGEAASVRSEQLRDVSSSSSLRKQALESNGARNGKDTDASSLADGVGASAGSKKEREATSGKSGRTTSSSSKRGVTSSQSIARFPGAQPGDRHYRSTPKLPNDPDAPVAPATALYWSPLPVHGVIPNKGLRAHTVNIIDSVAWVFGGCDERGCWAEVWCLDVDTLRWSHPKMMGEIPPPCRAHSATLVDRKLVVYGGGDGGTYYSDVYVLDTVTRRWTRVHFPKEAEQPSARRAHSAVFFHGKIWVFGGGNGVEAVNDVWTLDVGGPSVTPDRMRWELVRTHGQSPEPRGYHTANLVGKEMVIVGGSDGRECFSDIWCLNLETLNWVRVNLEPPLRRRLAHSSTQIGSYLFIMGGHDGSNYTSETLLFNLVSLQFEPRAILGRRPAPRGYHVAFLADSRLIVMGGFNGSDVFDDVYALELAAAAYLPQVTSFTMEFD